MERSRPVEYWKNKEGFFPDGRKLKILVCKANDGGCAFYRAIDPYRKLEQLYPNVVEIKWDDNPLKTEPDPNNQGRFKYDLEHDHASMKWSDVVFFHNIHRYGGPYTTRICGIAKELGKIAHYDTDDLLTELYQDHRLVDVYNKGGLSDMTKFIYYNSDIVTVTQRKFAELIAPYCRKNLSIIKNAIDYSFPCWNAKRTAPPRKNTCRIGWAAGIHHEADVKEFTGIPWLVNQKVGAENVFWGFYGHPPMPKPGDKPDWQHDVWKNYRKHLTSGMKGQRNWDIFLAFPPDQYGVIYTNIDVSIAPLQMNRFNDSKCVIGKSRVSTPDGIKRIDDESFKKVYSEFGWLDVNHRFKYEKRHVLTVETNNGYSITGTPNHRVMTTNRGLIELENILPGDSLKLSPLELQENLPYKEVTAPLLLTKKLENINSSDLDDILIPKVTIEENWATYLGLVLGDGNIQTSNSIRISFDKKDQDVVNWINTFGKKVGVLPVIRDQSEGGGLIEFNSRNLKWLLMNKMDMAFSDIPGEGKHGVKKRFKVPEIIWQSRKSVIAAFLRGLFEADGTNQNCGVALTSKSEELIREVQMLLLAFGIKSRLYSYYNNTYKKNYWTITVGRQGAEIFAKEIGFIGERKNSILKEVITKKHSNKYKEWVWEDEVTSIKYGGTHDVFDIEVDHPEHLYIVNGIVNHNSEIKVAECGRYGVPLVASNIGCYDETIKNGETGYLVPPNASKSEWVSVLSKVIKDKKHREEMGANLKKITDEYFDLNKVVHNRLNLYADYFNL